MGATEIIAVVVAGIGLWSSILHIREHYSKKSATPASDASASPVSAPASDASASPVSTPASGESASNAAAGTRRTLTIKDVEFSFRYCPPGTFTTGSPNGGPFGDETRRRVTLARGFWTLETPVTQRMYRAIMGTNPSRFRLGENWPVEQVSWRDCQEFLEALNALNVAPEGLTFRLLRETEWEYACRAGASGANDAELPLDEAGWYRANSGNRTREVGGKRPNAWGLYDMLGNVWEWVADRYEDGAALQLETSGPSDGARRVLRGGGWSDGAEYCRAACRFNSDPTYRVDNFGFRIALGVRR